jgi:glutathione synthase/RimK-type ligase-like ATP-grasp enzyme
MKAIAYLTSADMVPGVRGARDDLFELELQLAQLVPACAARGLSLELLVWNDGQTAARVAAGEFAAVVVGTPWDYQDHPEQFLAAIDNFARSVPVLNPPAVLRWNTHKSYLRDLSAAGVREVPTMWVEQVHAHAIAMAHGVLDSSRLVVKSVVGACAFRQACIEEGEPLPSADHLPLAGALIQPFVPSVQTEGELSFVYCGGQFSHALVKRPRQGDYRVQSIYGGTESVYEPTESELATAHAVVAAVPGAAPEDILYARVDFVRDEDGSLMLMELELIEPYLYPEQGPGLGEAYAAALECALARTSGAGEVGEVVEGGLE